jgi:hypothetical protein
MHGIAKGTKQVQCLPGELVPPFYRLVAVTDTTTHQNEARNATVFTTGVELPAKELNCVGFDTHVLTKDTINSVSFGPTVTVGTIVLTAPIQVHARSRNKPGIDGFSGAKDAFGSYFVDGHTVY